MHVALARCQVLPEPDPDEALLLAALRQAGLTADALAWDDPRADFVSAAVTVIRATWNYPESPEPFLAWAERTAAVTSLWNPIHVVRWNLHKRYLLDLEAAGVPVVPTCLIGRGTRTRLVDVVSARGWRDVVVKPAISAASRRTMRVVPGEEEKGEEHLRLVLSEGDALVQPYQQSVEGEGERSIVWIDGEITHAVRKSPRLADDHESVSGPLPVRPAEAELARRAIAAAPKPLLYARIDMAADEGGELRIMELELIEPSLFLEKSPLALDRLAAAIARECSRL